MSAEHATGDVPRLAPRQAEIFGFLFETTRATGIQPSFREVCARFGYQSTNAFASNLEAMRRKRWLGPSWRRSRSFHFLRNPDGTPFRGFGPPPPEDAPHER